MNNLLKDKVINDKWYSFRRYFVDEFFFKNTTFFTDKEVIDIGGKKFKKRGEFDINKINPNVKYANISPKEEPDYLCDASSIPVENETFDCVILAEVIEHVPNPIDVLKESYRILKTDGYLFITVPFHFHIHADPYDYGRYTDFWFYEKSKEIGFTDIKIEKQGLFFSVIANMIKLAYYEMVKHNKLNKLQSKIFNRIVKVIIKKSFIWDKKKFVQNNWFFNGYTTGFGIICKK